MCITNDDLDKGRGNGTLCKCVQVKLKRGAKRKWKNWDGRKVWTISSEDVKWIKFEHWPGPPRNATRYFKLKPQTFSTTVRFPVTQDCSMKLGNVSVTQFAVNSNIATTGHKLQGSRVVLPSTGPCCGTDCFQGGGQGGLGHGVRGD